MQWYRIRDHQFTQCFTILQLGDRISTQYPMCDDGYYLRGTACFGICELLGCGAQRTAGIRHVVDEDGGLVSHQACERHSGDGTGLFAFFASIDIRRCNACGNVEGQTE